MAIKLINDTYLSDIADAIRTKKSSSNTMTPSEMADEILSISGGGELNVPNGVLHQCRTEGNSTIPEHSFIEIDKIGIVEQIFNKTETGGDLYYAEPINDNTYLVIMQQMPSYGNYRMYYILGNIVNNNFNYLDGGQLPTQDSEFISEYTFPSRIFKTRSNEYVYFQHNTLFPFNIINNRVVFGTSLLCDDGWGFYNVPDATCSYDYNISSYGQFLDDYILFGYKPQNNSSSTTWKNAVLLLEVKNNMVRRHSAVKYDGTASAKSYTNIIQFNKDDETIENNIYAVMECSYSTSQSQYVQEVRPFKISLNTETNKYHLEFNWPQSVWFKGQYDTCFLPSYSTPGQYYSFCKYSDKQKQLGKYVILNNETAGIPATQSEDYEELLQQNIIDWPTSLTPTNIIDFIGKRMYMATALGYGYYCVMSYHNNTNYLLLLKETNNQLKYIREIELPSDASGIGGFIRLGEGNGKMIVFVSPEGQNMVGLNVDTTALIVKVLSTTTAEIDGIANSQITNSSGMGWFKE